MVRWICPKDELIPSRIRSEDDATGVKWVSPPTARQECVLRKRKTLRGRSLAACASGASVSSQRLQRPPYVLCTRLRPHKIVRSLTGVCSAVDRSVSLAGENKMSRHGCGWRLGNLNERRVSRNQIFSSVVSARAATALGCNSCVRLGHSACFTWCNKPFADLYWMSLGRMEQTYLREREHVTMGSTSDGFTNTIRIKGISPEEQLRLGCVCLSKECTPTLFVRIHKCHAHQRRERF